MWLKVQNSSGEINIFDTNEVSRIQQVQREGKSQVHIVFTHIATSRGGTRISITGPDVFNMLPKEDFITITDNDGDLLAINTHNIQGGFFIEDDVQIFTRGGGAIGFYKGTISDADLNTLKQALLAKIGE